MKRLGAVAAVAAGVAVGFLVLRWRRERQMASARAQPTLTASKGVPRVKDAAAAVAAIRAEGVCIIERVLDAAFLQDLRSRLDTIEPRKMQNRRAHRWEHVHSPETPPLAELASHALITEVARALLGPKHYLEKAGMLVSYHGAEAQRWHMDTPHLFSVGTHLPPHSLSVFVPFCDLIPSNGPTEFQLGTHVRANLVAKQRQAIASCPAGSLVMYDPRTMHRGGPNESSAERALIYLTFSRNWYRDTLNP